MSGWHLAEKFLFHIFATVVAILVGAATKGRAIICPGNYLRCSDLAIADHDFTCSKLQEVFDLFRILSGQNSAGILRISSHGSSSQYLSCRSPSQA